MFMRQQHALVRLRGLCLERGRGRRGWRRKLRVRRWECHGKGDERRQ
jgi:hypothetical protein